MCLQQSYRLLRFWSHFATNQASYEHNHHIYTECLLPIVEYDLSNGDLRPTLLWVLVFNSVRSAVHL